MLLKDQYILSQDTAFIQRLQCQIVASAIAIYNEVANEVQAVAFTGTASDTLTLTAGW